jgi:glycine C-acetyltransferase
MSKAGVTRVLGELPIVPVMLSDARLASEMRANLVKEGIYAASFSFPVAPKGTRVFVHK